MIELSETANFVYNFVQKPYTSGQLWRHIWPTFPLNLLCGFHRRWLSTSSIMVQKVKNDQTQIKEGVNVWCVNYTEMKSLSTLTNTREFKLLESLPRQQVVEAS